jgi:hypothetical protein
VWAEGIPRLLNPVHFVSARSVSINSAPNTGNLLSSFRNGPSYFIMAAWHGVTNQASYSRRKITASFGNVTVRGENDAKEKGEARWRSICLGMYSITENFYYSQLSSVASLLQPEPVSHI